MVPFANGNSYGLAAGQTEGKGKQKNRYGIALFISRIDISPQAAPQRYTVGLR
jgi:hypothetical protein